MAPFSAGTSDSQCPQLHTHSLPFFNCGGGGSERESERERECVCACVCTGINKGSCWKFGEWVRACVRASFNMGPCWKVWTIRLLVCSCEYYSVRLRWWRGVILLTLPWIAHQFMSEDTDACAPASAKLPSATDWALNLKRNAESTADLHFSSL